MKPVKTALLSFGMSGKLFHAPFLQVTPGFQFYAVWERTKNTVKESYPEVIRYENLDHLLSNGEIELVVVNTPNYTHFEYAKKALEAGKHVVVEKPFTVSVEEGEELIRIAKDKQLYLSVYQNRRYDSDYRTVKKLIEEDILGQIVEAEFHFDRYRVELSPKPHKEEARPGTGALYDLGSHLIDQALQLFGWPKAVFADIRMVRPLSKVDDYFELLFYYPRLRVRLHCSYLVRESLPAYQIHGLKGSFIKHKTNIQETALQAGEVPGSPGWGIESDSEKGLLHTEKDGNVIREFINSCQGNYADYYEALFQSIRNNKPLPVTAEDGLNVIRLIKAAFSSMEQGKIVHL